MGSLIHAVLVCMGVGQLLSVRGLVAPRGHKYKIRLLEILNEVPELLLRITCSFFHMASLRQPVKTSLVKSSVGNVDDSITINESPPSGAQQSEKHGASFLLLRTTIIIVYQHHPPARQEQYQLASARRPPQPYSIYTPGEKWFILAVASFAAMFR